MMFPGDRQPSLVQMVILALGVLLMWLPLLTSSWHLQRVHLILPITYYHCTLDLTHWYFMMRL